MQISLKCNHCGTRLRTDISMVKKQLNCKYCKHNIQVPLTNVPVGIVQDDYWILKPVGSGDISETYIVKRGESERLYMKVLSLAVTTDERRTAEYLVNLRQSCTLTHPNILQVSESGTILDHHFVVTRFVEGEFMDKLIQQNGPMRESEALSFMIQVAVILRSCWTDHSRWHGSLRPSNILLGEDGQIYIADFGSDKSLLLGPGEQLETLDFGGTIADYMSPEQLAADARVDYRTDIYSFGATLFYLCTGKKPYSGTETSEIVNKHLKAPVPDAHRIDSQVSQDMAKLIRAMMAKNPSDRLPSWSRVIQRIKAVHKRSATHKSLRTSLRSVTTPPTSRRTSNNSYQLAIIFLVAMLVIGSFGLDWLLSHPAEPTPQPPPPKLARRIRKPPPRITLPSRPIPPKPEPVKRPPPVAKTIDAAVIGLATIDHQDKTKKLLVDGAVVHIAEGEKLRIRADVMGTASSLAFYLDGTDEPYIQNETPFTFVWDVNEDGETGHIGWGDHIIEAKPFAEKDAKGATGRSIKVAFSIAQAEIKKPEPEEPTETTAEVKPKPVEDDSPIQFTLIDADSDKPIGPLLDGGLIDIQRYPVVNIAVEAEMNVTHMVLYWSNRKSKTEKNPPFAVGGDNDGNFWDLDAKVGKHRVKAEAYKGKKLVATRTITVEVVKGAPTVVLSEGGGTKNASLPVRPIFPTEQKKLTTQSLHAWEFTGCRSSTIPGGIRCEGKIVRMASPSLTISGPLTLKINLSGRTRYKMQVRIFKTKADNKKNRKNKKAPTPSKTIAISSREQTFTFTTNIAPNQDSVTVELSQPKDKVRLDISSITFKPAEGDSLTWE